jgi:hypothetical protein
MISDKISHWHVFDSKNCTQLFFSKKSGLTQTIFHQSQQMPIKRGLRITTTDYVYISALLAIIAYVSCTKFTDQGYTLYQSILIVISIVASCCIVPAVVLIFYIGSGNKKAEKKMRKRRRLRRGGFEYSHFDPSLTKAFENLYDVSYARKWTIFIILLHNYKRYKSNKIIRSSLSNLSYCWPQTYK